MPPVTRRALLANKTVYPELTLYVRMISACARSEPWWIRFYIQSIKMSLWPDGILVFWVLCVRSNCNFTSGGYGIAARQTDGMSCINIFMLEALPTSRMCTLGWCKVLLPSKPGWFNCNTSKSSDLGRAPCLPWSWINSALNGPRILRSAGPH